MPSEKASSGPTPGDVIKIDDDWVEVKDEGSPFHLVNGSVEVIAMEMNLTVTAAAQIPVTAVIRMTLRGRTIAGLERLELLCPLLLSGVSIAQCTRKRNQTLCIFCRQVGRLRHSCVGDGLELTVRVLTVQSMLKTGSAGNAIMVGRFEMPTTWYSSLTVSNLSLTPLIVVPESRPP